MLYIRCDFVSNRSSHNTNFSDVRRDVMSLTCRYFRAPSAASLFTRQTSDMETRSEVCRLQIILQFCTINRKTNKPSQFSYV